MSNEEALRRLKTYLLAFGFLTEGDVEDLLRHVSFRKLERNEFFIREGEVNDEVGFVLSGIFRSFYVSPVGDEITYCILFPDIFIAAYSSYITGNPSVENIQAIAPAALIVLPRREIARLSAVSTGWLRFEKMVAEQQYLELERRVFQFQKESAAERYASLLRDYPDYVKHIPLHYLASYLGITQRHLSRIRREAAAF
ncbi:MAG: Crp/Fnr family transcriptional regulator [Bacteroidia bacterium]|jgi:CRP-like cAMP-binding protein|nr:Crp/Fnr family transcriptional regulator [Bacteroidia bacterium]